jgi:hypothetical protein
MAASVPGVNFDSNIHNLTLGHIIDAIKDNKSNNPYLRHAQFIEQRREMMENWEKYARSLLPPDSRKAKAAPPKDDSPRRIGNVVKISERRSA